MNIIIFGAPGSGKGTQVKMLGDFYQLKRVSLGDILRQVVKEGTDLGRKVRGYMEEGELVPDELVSYLIDENINSQGFILDGYPRNLNQAVILEEILKKKGLNFDVFIYLDVDEKIIVERLAGRRVCRKCGANYHLESVSSKKTGICDLCGGELFQREDDSPKVIKNRWKVFLKESRRLLDFYRSKGKFITVDGGGSKEEIFQNLKRQL
ncbi:MAG: adenylate kinase [Candidatus Omnitrophica bacterium]|nr:adenylate kinase [Candidatus Omnitrophota bacterium]MBU0878578.1 adenylate kinase [Candidatus Omnitrophota bacterium]MBU0896041.1 adenylate kinase [Candidatus Omnitrophota bacterium]MBU1133985.1 adenylate kinase [Candidatus Omnitrophota bacterium]MBU1367277.1 adenylate kinase [Candidatus Omnitrophota bacterium]